MEIVTVAMVAMKVVNPLRSGMTHWLNVLTMRMDGT